MSRITYRTHVLLGLMSGGDLYVVRRWDHVPTQSDVDKAIASAPNNYVAFVVSACVGPPLPGNLVMGF